jgi:hypothetical protein
MPINRRAGLNEKGTGFLQSDMLVCVEETIYFGTHTKLVPMRNARKFPAIVGFAVIANWDCIPDEADQALFVSSPQEMKMPEYWAPASSWCATSLVDFPVKPQVAG